MAHGRHDTDLEGKVKKAVLLHLGGFGGGLRFFLFGDAEVGLAILTPDQLPANAVWNRKKLAATEIGANDLNWHGISCVLSAGITIRLNGSNAPRKGVARGLFRHFTGARLGLGTFMAGWSVRRMPVADDRVSRQCLVAG